MTGFKQFHNLVKPGLNKTEEHFVCDIASRNKKEFFWPPKTHVCMIEVVIFCDDDSSFRICYLRYFFIGAAVFFRQIICVNLVKSQVIEYVNKPFGQLSIHQKPHDVMLE